MKLLLVPIMAATLCAGCTSLSPEAADVAQAETAKAPKTVLKEADAKLAAAEYGGAQALYAEFVSAYPDHAETPRARAIQTVLDRLLAAEAELNRVKRSDEVPQLRRELAERQSEVDRLKAETAKLRADMERLRDIDLQTLPGKKRK